GYGLSAAPTAAECSTIRTEGEEKALLPRAKKVPESEPMWLYAVRAAEDKQAHDIRVLDLREITSFADYFVICTGGNSRQIQSIADEIEQRLKKLGERAISMEGYDNSEWVLMDY